MLILRVSLEGLLAVDAFGSFETKYQTAMSDLEIAALCKAPAENLKRWKVCENLGAELGLDVDLVDPLAASTVFGFEGVNSATRFYCADPAKCEEFEDLCTSMYIRFNEERAGIIS